MLLVPSLSGVRNSPSMTNPEKDRHASAQPPEFHLLETLANLGQAVIQTNEQDRVVLMNSCAEALTGWTMSDAKLHDIDQILVRTGPDQILSRDGCVHNVEVLSTSNGTGLQGRTFLLRRKAEPILSETELHRSEERFRHLVENTHDYAIFMLDSTGHIVSWNRGAERIKGYVASEIIGKHFSVFYKRDSVAAGWPEEELRRAKAEGRFEDEGWRVRKDGSEFWANVIITALRDPEGRLWGFSKITRDLTSRRELERAQLEAEFLTDINRKKDEFIAMLSHELRNPLSPILNSVHVLRAVPGSQVALDTIERQVLHMNRLVEDLLDVSRINTGRIQIRHEVVDLCEIVRKAAEAVQGNAERAEVSVRLRFPQGNVLVIGDATRLEQVLGNLLVNSIKYSKAGSEVRVTLHTERAQAVLSVQDDGIGIPHELLPHVFDLFTQAEKSLDRAQGGLGIGLAVVKSVVNLLGGTVEASSEGVGHGSRFVVKLPLTEEALPFEESDVVRPQIGMRRVLIVDDNRDAADLLALVLRTHGHEVFVAYDGQEALDLAMSCRPEAILLDLGLPLVDGYEVARRLRSNRAFDSVRLVAVSGYGQPKDRERTKNIGFDEHLVKPVEPKAVFEAIQGS